MSNRLEAQAPFAGSVGPDLNTTLKHSSPEVLNPAPRLASTDLPGIARQGHVLAKQGGADPEREEVAKLEHFTGFKIVAPGVIAELLRTPNHYRLHLEKPSSADQTDSRLRGAANTRTIRALLSSMGSAGGGGSSAKLGDLFGTSHVEVVSLYPQAMRAFVTSLRANNRVNGVSLSKEQRGHLADLIDGKSRERVKIVTATHTITAERTLPTALMLLGAVLKCLSDRHTYPLRLVGWKINVSPNQTQDRVTDDNQTVLGVSRSWLGATLRMKVVPVGLLTASFAAVYVSGPGTLGSISNAIGAIAALGTLASAIRNYRAVSRVKDYARALTQKV